MNGHAGSAVPAQAGPSKLKSSNTTNGNGINGSSTPNVPMNSHESVPSPSASHASTVHVPVGNGSGHAGPLSGASPYFQPAAVNMSYGSPQPAQMMGTYAYYHPQQQQQQHHQGYAGYPPAGGNYPMRTPPNGSTNGGSTGNAGYSRQNSYHHQQQQQGHFQQQQHQHMPSYDYNAHMHHAAGNAAGPSRYQGYSPYNPYYPQPVYAQQGPAMQASPYPVYQPSGGAYPGAQPMYYDPSMYYQPPPASGRPPYSYMHQGANGPYPYVMPTGDLTHPMSTPLQPQTPSSSHVSPYPTSQLPQASISNPPLPPPRDSDQPPQPPPPIETSDSSTAEGMSKGGKSDPMPVFASVMRSSVIIKKDETASPVVGDGTKVDKEEKAPDVQEEPKAEVDQSVHGENIEEGEVGNVGTSGDAQAEIAAEEVSEPVEEASGPSESENKEAVVPEKEVEVDGFCVNDEQTYLHGRGRPADQVEAPAVLFSSKLSHGSQASARWTVWSGRVEIGSQGDRLDSSEKRRQNRVLAFAHKRIQSSSPDAGTLFGEVDASMIAESTRSIRERAKQAKVAAEEATKHAANVEPASEESTRSAEAEAASPPAEQTTATEPTTTSPASLPPQPSVKAAPKSWAALLRPAAPATTSPASGAARPAPAGPSSSSEPLAEEQIESEGASKSGLPTEGGKPRPTGYAAAAAAGAAAWGAAGRSGELDLGKLLSEGVGGLPLSAGAAGLASVPRGLINTGNMCFANSIMQVLAYCNPFNILLQELSKRIKADLGGRTRLLEAMMLFLREFAAAEMGDSEPNGSGIASENAIPASAKPEKVSSGGIAKSGEAFVPTYVYEAMRENKRFDTMRRGHQEDAEEFMGFFLETLHEELLYLVSRHESRTVKGPRRDIAVASNKPSDGTSEEREVTRPVSPSAGRDDGWLEVGKNQKLNVVRTTTSRESAISRIFGGKLRSVLRTPGQKDSVTLEPYQPLQLDISAPNVHTITEALLHLNEPETISGVYSASRGTNVDATKTVYLETVPPILTLHLKRFLYDPVENRVVKKGKAVAYGPELIIPSSIISPARRPAGGELRYRLFGVVYHHGSTATGGHYTACVLKQDGKGWLHLDDELVENVEGDAGVYVTRDAAVHGEAGTVGRSMRSKCAYLLFYARI